MSYHQHLQNKTFKKESYSIDQEFKPKHVVIITITNKIRVRTSEQLHKKPIFPMYQPIPKKPTFSQTPYSHRRLFRTYIANLIRSHQKNIGTIENLHNLQIITKYLENNQVISPQSSSYPLVRTWFHQLEIKNTGTGACPCRCRRYYKQQFWRLCGNFNDTSPQRHSDLLWINPIQSQSIIWQLLCL